MPSNKKRKRGGGRKPSAFKRTALPDMSQAARLNATRLNETGEKGMVRQMILIQRIVAKMRNYSLAELGRDLLSSISYFSHKALAGGSVTELKAVSLPARYFLAQWLAEASAADLRALANWIERCPPGKPAEPSDPLAFSLLELPRSMFVVEDQEGRVRRLLPGHGADEMLTKEEREGRVHRLKLGVLLGHGLDGKLDPSDVWVDLQGRPVDYDTLAPSAHVVGFADPIKCLAHMSNLEVLTALDDLYDLKVSPDALRKALKNLGVARPKSQQNPGRTSG